jgi:hypothetical protein
MNGRVLVFILLGSTVATVLVFQGLDLLTK